MEKVKDWNYKVVEKIGQGVFGEVCKCLNRETGQKVAIKMIAIQNEADGVPSYLIAGVSLLKELEHDNIVRLLDVLNGNRYWYLVFEYLDLDLGSLIRKHTITSIRPLVKEVESPYKAPESRICSSVYSTPHDVWAVGCIFAEMVSGKPLFPCGKKDHLSLIVRLFGNPTKETWPGANYISELLHSLPQCEPADLAEKTHGLEPSGVELLSQMLCLDPDHRVTANDALLHRYLRGAEDLRIAETESFELPSSNNHALFKKFLKGDFKVPCWYTESADTVPSGLPAAVRNDQNQDFEKASRSSPSCDQGVYSSQMHDKYEYRRAIAKTRGSLVHKCRHYETDRIVAIKNINFKDLSEGVPSSVIREVALLKKLEHKYIVRLLDVQSDVKSANLVFEYVNITFYNVIQHYHPIDLRLIKKFLYCILSGISYCHAHKILHRDLTPTNLLVDTKNKIVKIADFGMAMEVDAPFDAHTTEVLTLYYRAPEFLLGRTNYSAAIDMWAVGCIFAEIYFGMPGADTLPEVTLISDHYWRKPIDKLNLAEELTRLEPDGLDLLFRMLSLNPTTRIAAESALNHPYFKGKGTRTSPLSSPEQ
ncbi:protein kinase domain-containing protein [Citrus sinensis]|nr:protein kinase domain-containing protein [Citrus sinensis]